MRAGEVIGVPVVDHVIVTRNANVYQSMFERGTLPRLDSAAAQERGATLIASPLFAIPFCTSSLGLLVLSQPRMSERAIAPIL
jgi:hypothetical protein